MHRLLLTAAAVVVAVTQVADADTATRLVKFEDCMTTATFADIDHSATIVELDADANFFVNSSSRYADYATGPKDRIQRKPAGVFFARSEDQVVRAVQCAVASDLAPVPRSGGHSYEVLSSMDGSLVIDIAEMNAVTVVEENEVDGTAIATVEGGARLGRLYLELDRQGGYSFSAGTCPGVGIGGHISGGGYGMSSRHYGLAADLTTELRVVLYNGTVVTANAEQHCELFWAIRGGGAGSFGIVTLFTVQVHKIPEVAVFHLHFAPQFNFELIRAWMDFFPTADSRVTTQLNVGKGETRLIGQFIGSQAEAEAMLNASGLLDIPDAVTSDVRRYNCTALGAKAFVDQGDCDAVAALNVSEHLTLANKDYTRIRGGYAVSDMSDDGVNTVVEWANLQPNTTWAFIQFESYGGVFATQANDFTPWNHRDAVYSMQIGIGTKKDEPETSPAYQWIDGILDALTSHLDGGNYQNYCDLALGDDYGERYWGADNFERLKQIKSVYDPDDVFHSAQSVPLA